MKGAPDCDLLIAGGGPAGLATAIRARLAGFDVTLLDHAAPPIDKACGEGLMPDGVALLERLGVEIPAGESQPFHGIRYVDGETIAAGRFPAGLPGRGIRRVALHRALVARAETAGVDLCWNEAVLDLEPDGLRTKRGRRRARWIVAADGLRSPLRQRAGLEGRVSRRRRFGLRRHYTVEPWSDSVEVHWTAHGEAYVTPVGPRTVGVAVLSSEVRRTFDTALSAWPALRRHVAGAGVESSDRGAGPLEQRVRGVVRGNLALVGDAAGYLDAITGEGLSVAFHQAFALVEAIEHGDLTRYAAAHRRIVALPNTLTRLLLAIERRPPLRRRLIRTLAARPEWFSRLLAVHARALRPSRLGLGTAARLVWSVLVSPPRAAG